MWYPIAPVYYVSRALESGHGLFFVLIGVVIIGILVWRKPPHWVAWSIVVGIAAVILAAMSGSRDRRY